MTIQSSITEQRYIGNGTTGPWAINFPITEPDDVSAIITDSNGIDTQLVYNKDYTVTPRTGPNEIGGTASVLVPTGSKILFYLNVDITQEVDLKNSGKTDVNQIEFMSDKLTLICLQLLSDIARSVKVSRTSNIDPKSIISSIESIAAQVAIDSGKVETAMANLFKDSIVFDTVNNKLDYPLSLAGVNGVEYNIVVFLGPNFQIEKDAYTLSADGKTLTFSSNPGANKCYVASTLSLSNPDLKTAINKYIAEAAKFSTVEDMKTSDFLVEGDIVKTSGYYVAGDSGGAMYKIESSGVADGIADHDISNGLIAKILVNGEVSVKQFGAKGDGVTDDTTNIQTAIDRSSGLSVKLPYGVYGVSGTMTIETPTHFYGDGNGIDDSLKTLEGSWLKLLSGNSLLSGQPVLSVTHTETPNTNRTFALVERIGIYGDRKNNTNGTGLSVTAKNVHVEKVSVIECSDDGIYCGDKDPNPGDNDGMNSSVFADLWVGYNSRNGMNLDRNHYSGDFIVRGCHFFWNDKSGIHCNQPNVLFDGTHSWWNYDGVVVDGTQARLGVLFSGVRIYDNAAAGIRLINSPKNINIATADIHGNGNQERWPFFNPPLTGADVTQDEQSGVYCNTDAINVILGTVNFGYLNETGRQRQGLRVTNSSAQFILGSVNSDGATSLQRDRVISVSGTPDIRYHNLYSEAIVQHPGFAAVSDIKMNGNSLLDTGSLSFWSWNLVPVTGAIGSEKLAVTGSTVVVSESSPKEIYSIDASGIGTSRAPMIIIRNSGANSITFKQNVNKLRLTGGTDKTLNIHEAIGFVAVSATAFQQIF